MTTWSDERIAPREQLVGRGAAKTNAEASVSRYRLSGVLTVYRRGHSSNKSRRWTWVCRRRMRCEPWSSWRHEVHDSGAVSDGGDRSSVSHLRDHLRSRRIPIKRHVQIGPGPEMTTNDDIRGSEYDWLAVDIEGFVGLFSTAGGGDAPDAFLEDIDAFDAAIAWNPIAASVHPRELQSTASSRTPRHVEAGGRARGVRIRLHAARGAVSSHCDARQSGSPEESSPEGQRCGCPSGTAHRCIPRMQ